MWNWGPPSSLKAYIDQAIIPGVFDIYGNKGLTGKSVTIFIASGGSYKSKPETDFESGYIEFIFSQLGSADVKVIRTELTLAGVVPGMESLIGAKEESLAENLDLAAARAKQI